ncbi:hypothetical protein [Candidatus Flexifilum breve]|uniref:hypothetical protein n=1 Tax=Candidatus Flexifilum breve TaxID=3140694 RepID=UPI0031CC9485
MSASSTIRKIVVTGGSGKPRAVVADLLDHGYDVVNVDINPPATRIVPFPRVDLTDYGRSSRAARRGCRCASGGDPAPDLISDQQTFLHQTALEHLQRLFGGGAASASAHCVGVQ